MTHICKSPRTYAWLGLVLAVMSGLFLLWPLWSSDRMEQGTTPWIAGAGLILGVLIFLFYRERQACKSQKRLVQKVIIALKPRSWKHWLFWVELIPLVIILLLTGVLGFYACQAYTDRYDVAPIEVIPEYTEVAVPFSHQYGEVPALPFLASAVIDVDGDGISELFLGGGVDQPDGLFRYADGRFIDISEDWLNDAIGPSFGAAVLDMDQNGSNDLLVSKLDGAWWYRNFDSRFTKTKLDLPIDPTSTPLGLTLGDINADGWADLFVSNYIRKDLVEGQTVFNDPDYGGKSQLFLNNGDNTFTDITDSAGLDYRHNTFQAVFIDLDGDRDQDLAVAHDTGQVKTWRNNGDSTFTDIPNPTSDYFAYPMGIAVGDYDNDGDIDLAFSNVGDMGPMNPVLRGDLRPDQVLHQDLILFENQGDFVFTDTATERKVADYEFSWGLLLADFNNDGLEDLVIGENYVDLPQHKLFPLPGRFLLQAPDGTFSNQEKAAGVISRDYHISPLIADFNNDGVWDLVYANLAGPARVFVSKGLPEQRYIRLRLPSTPESLGAKATLTHQDGSTQTQYFVTGEGLGSAGDSLLHFGVGPEPKLRDLTVEYLSGATKTLDRFLYNITLELE